MLRIFYEAQTSVPPSPGISGLVFSQLPNAQAFGEIFLADAPGFASGRSASVAEYRASREIKRAD
jgi:hypothetical protein